MNLEKNIHLGGIWGFAWNVVDPMTFKVLQCNTDKQKMNQVLNRHVIVPRRLEAVGYNSYLAPNSDTYFTVV